MRFRLGAGCPKSHQSHRSVQSLVLRRKALRIITRTLSSVILLMFFSGMAFADDASVCDELSKHACNDQSEHDGTGSIKNSADFNRQITNLRLETRKKLISSYLSAFQSANSDPMAKAFLLRSSRLLMGSNTKGFRSTCWEQDGQFNATCQNELAEKIADGYGLDFIMDKWGAGGFDDQKYVVDDKSEAAPWVQDPSVGFAKFSKPAQDFLREQIVKPDRLRKLEATFAMVKNLLVKRLEESGASDSEKYAMISKIKKAQLNPQGCARFRKPINNDLIADAFYTENEMGEGKVQFCNGLLLRGDSEFMIVETLAHELSHSLDPCHFSTGSKGHPFQSVLACLRSPKSVNAIAKGTSREECISHDQIGEAFADWMAAEILPRYMATKGKVGASKARAGYANAVKITCGGEANRVFNVHAQSKRRIDALLMTQPLVREHMDCRLAPTTGVGYCAEGSDSASIPVKTSR